MYEPHKLAQQFILLTDQRDVLEKVVPLENTSALLVLHSIRIFSHDPVETSLIWRGYIELHLR